MADTSRASPLSAMSRGEFLRAGSVVLASIVTAFALTILFRPLLDRTLFVFMYGAVAVSALYAGWVAGIASSILTIVLIEAFLPSPDRFDFGRPQDLASVAIFILGSTLIAAIARSIRVARYSAEESAQRLREQAAEMEARRAEAEALADDLEQSTVELETAIDDANDQRNAAIASEERMRLVENAARVLAASLDYETTVSAVAQLAVPKFADWAAVDLLVDGEIQQLAVAHVDPAKVAWAKELRRKTPMDPNDPNGAPAVIRTGQPQLLTDVTDELLAKTARSPDQLRLLREIGVYSVIIVPMIARAQTLGSMSLVSSNPGRHYSTDDLSLAMQLANRAAIAIDNARLYRAALAANEAKANFLATMSHELRTPLTAIIGYEELLAEGIPGNVNEAQRQQLHRIKVSASHLLSLIDEILLFARVEAGRETVRIEPVVAKGVVDDAIAFVAPSAKERSLDLHAERIDPTLMLRTDGGKLRQMLLNLLANAIKFTPKGSVCVRAYENNGNVLFDVQDTGIGIAPKDLASIFDPFWQVEQNTTRKAGGSGLGLSVTRRLAHLLGGEVTVESQPLQGSTFRITLPKDPPR